MWNADEWKKFLSDQCKNYAKEHIDNDAKFLAEQSFGPSTFNSLVEIYERDFHFFKQSFPIFTLGNLIRFVDGMKGYDRGKEYLSEKPVPVDAEYSLSLSFKKIYYLILKYLVSIRSKRVRGWLNNVKKYMFYFVREGEEEHFGKRCACAISPTIAVTFAHGRNKRFMTRNAYKGEMVEQGSILNFYSLYNSYEEIKAEVVLIDHVADFILLEALEGKKFFDGDNNTNILKDPIIGEELLAIGLSSKTSSQPTFTTGVVLSTGPYRQMVSDIISWEGDSGGGLFSRNNKLLGIISASQESDEGEWSRIHFAPATQIKYAWNKFMEESGQKEKHQGIRRSDE